MTNQPTESPADELPGMLALAQGVANQTWPHTVDAQVWTEEWLRTLAEHPDIATDKATMIGWFANAIMAGYDTASMRNATALQAERERCAELEAQHAAWLIERAELTALATGLEAERDAYRIALAKATGSTAPPPYAAPDCEPPRETLE